MAEPAGGIVERLVLAVTAEVGRGIDTALSVYSKVSTAAAAATVAAGGFALATAHAFDETAKTAASLQMTTERYSSLAYAADRSGVSTSALGTAMNALQVNLEGAARGSGEGKAWLDKVGISATDSAGKVRSAGEVIEEVADAYTRLGSKGERASFSVRLLGESGGRMATLLEGGADGIRSLTEDAEYLGIVLDSQTAAASTALVDSWTRLRASVSGLGYEIGGKLIPLMIPLVDQLTELVVQSDGFARVGIDKAARAAAWGFERLNTPAGKTVAIFTGLGAVLGVARGAAGVASTLSTMSPMLGGLASSFGGAAYLAAPFALAVAGLGLVLEDLVVTAEGGDSITRDIADSFGYGEETALGLREAWMWLAESGEDLANRTFPVLSGAAQAWITLAKEAVLSGSEMVVSLWGLAEPLRDLSMRVTGLKALAEYFEWDPWSTPLGQFLGWVGDNLNLDRALSGFSKLNRYMAGDAAVQRTGYADDKVKGGQGFSTILPTINPAMMLATAARSRAQAEMAGRPSSLGGSSPAMVASAGGGAPSIQVTNQITADGGRAVREAGRATEQATRQALQQIELSQ